MARIEEGVLRKYNPGDRMTDVDYQRDREVFRVSINDLDDKYQLLQPESVQDLKDAVELARYDEEGNPYSTLKERLDSEKAEQNNKIGILEQAELHVLNYSNLVDETLQDWSAAVQQAVDDAPDNGIVRLPSGQQFKFSDIKVTGKSLTITGEGVRVIQNKNKPVFDLKGGWDFTATVSSISTVNYDYSQGNNTFTPVSMVTLSEQQALKSGDVVKIFSDDLIEETFQPSTGTARKRKGEYASVAHVSGFDVFLTGKLRETYSSNIRLAKMKNVSFTLKGIEFDVDPLGETETPKWNPKMIKITACKNLTLDNVRSLNGYEAFILLMGVYGYTANNVHARNHRNEPVNGRYGYAINDTSCEFGSVSNSTFTNCRHGFTTATAAIEPGNINPELYGRSANTVVSDSKGFGCSNAAFDVHEEAYNIKFVNCDSIGDYAGAVGSGYGFQARAKKVQFSNCVAVGSRGGFYIFEQYSGTTNDIYLENCKTFNVETSLQVKGSSGLRVKKVKIQGGRFESYGNIGNTLENADIDFNNVNVVTVGYQGMLMTNAKVAFSNSKLENESSVAASRIIEMQTSSVLKLNNVVLNIENISVTDGKLIRMLDSSCSINGDKVEVNTAGKALFAVFDGLSTNKGDLKVTNIKADADVSVVNEANFDELAVSWATPTKSSSAIFQDLASDGLTLNTRGLANDTIYVRVKALTANRVLGTIPPGSKLGQVLVIRNSASSFTTTIKHGTTYNTALGTDKVLPVDGAITLIWTGSQWVNTN